ncbi:MAG: hypothetical protein SFY81_04995 [Verrucomicrobiota bacterium]|nr:hypothetical protein [Verrucomicrobiota bacterium]
MIILSKNQLEALLDANGIYAENALILDSQYALPTKRWLLNEFAVALRNWYFSLGLSGYTAGSNDCENFARGAAFYADLAHRNSSRKNGVETTGLAFGEFWYRQRDGKGGHAINIAIVAEGKPEIIFFEPQTQQQVPLIQQEIAPCIGYRF